MIEALAEAPERRSVVDSGHDETLGVLWLRLDRLPDPEWRAAFERERSTKDVEAELFRQHVLCTATPDSRRRVERVARRVIGATNGAVGGTIVTVPRGQS